MKSIFVRVFLVFCIVIMLLSGLLLFSSLKIIQNHYLRGVIITLKTSGRVVSSRVIPLIKKRKFSELKKLVKGISEQTGLYLEVLDNENKVLAAVNPNIVTQKNFLFVDLPLSYHDKNIGKLKMGMPLSHINPEMDKLVWEMSVLTIGLICLCLGIAFIFARSISLALNKLTLATKQIGEGNFDIELKSKGEDEFAVLAQNFNNMAKKIKKLITGLVHKQEEVNSIISMLQQALIVVDGNGKIVACNEAFKDLVGKENLVGAIYKDVFRDKGLIVLVEKIFTQRKNVATKVKLKKKVFICNVTFLTNQNKMIMTLQDISTIESA